MEPSKKKNKKGDYSKDETAKRIEALDQKLKAQKKTIQKFLEQIRQQKDLKEPI